MKVKYKLKREQWKEITTWLNPRYTEDVAHRHAGKLQLREAATCLLLTDLGVRIVTSIIKGKAEISISFTPSEAFEMIGFLSHMSGQSPSGLYLKNIANAMEIELQNKLVNYKKVYQ